tara:strand:+ start:417 stop:560 length:144 start_codon:yes stop_codon:yes gene_type:complete
MNGEKAWSESFRPSCFGMIVFIKDQNGFRASQQKMVLTTVFVGHFET